MVCDGVTDLVFDSCCKERGEDRDQRITREVRRGREESRGCVGERYAAKRDQPKDSDKSAVCLGFSLQEGMMVSRTRSVDRQTLPLFPDET